MKIVNINLPSEGLVLVAGRLGIGKSYVMIEMANELNKNGVKSVLVYADGISPHDIVQYQNGKIHTSASKLSHIQNVYPDIPFVVEDAAGQFTPYTWQLFLNDYIEHEQPQVLFIDHIVNSNEKASDELLRILQKISKEKHVLILAEINISKNTDIRKDKRLKPKYVMCTMRARRYVDKFIFVYRDFNNWVDGKDIVSKTIEIYTTADEKSILPFCPEKYTTE